MCKNIARSLRPALLLIRAYNLPTFCTVLFLHRADYLREQGHTKIYLTNHKEVADILHNAQSLCFDNKPQQDIRRKKDVRLFQYTPHNYKYF